SLDEVGNSRTDNRYLHRVGAVLRDRRRDTGLSEGVFALVRQGRGFPGLLLPGGVVAVVDVVLCFGEGEPHAVVQLLALRQRPLRPGVRAVLGQQVLDVGDRVVGVDDACESCHLGQAPGVRAGAVVVLAQLRHAEVVVHAPVAAGRRLARRHHRCVGDPARQREDGGERCSREKTSRRWLHASCCFCFERKRLIKFVDASCLLGRN
uniref:Uncharacterized protein n=1 Tax=Triticum urartu TaxID=4572 RepID=A0A8R7QR08_TRIUA